ncbi:hypothetical protein LSUE1_G001023 [Lachnellula suecica]|uniref:Mediator of RNA polymerase II transcription subunit 8 n=1 Tax=Lachnellula suecica TaxID=602035 RepID=A0A8T9CI06_9HELO|nr:hypothetical protein LSUE1_G001023 [Lachnellula suecica]
MAMDQQKGTQQSATAAPSSANGQAGSGMEGNTGEDWDEEKLEKALARLKEMHIQLKNLRTTVPRLLEPLTKKQPSPQVLFSEFSKSTATANEEVQQFQKLMREEETSQVLEQARKSRAERPNDIKPWRARDHPDWLTRDT